MKLKNIVIVNDYSYINGGASKVAITSAIKLSQIGFNVILFSAVSSKNEELKNSGIKIITTNQYDMLSNPNRISAFVQGIWNKKAEKEFLRLLNSLDRGNTIVHIHSWTKALSSSVVLCAIKSKFKAILTLHDYFSICPNGGMFNYNTNEICYLEPMSKECILCNCDSRHYYHKIWRVLRQSKQIKKGLLPAKVKNYIYISKMSKDILSPFLPQDSNFYYVKNPVDIKKNYPVDVAKNKTFVYVGRLSKEKGCLLLAEAAKELNLNVVFVGDGELKDQIKNIYLNARITGWLSKAQVEKELENARILVFPSLWYETLGLTALEAQAKGIPVIVSDMCTAKEVIKNGRTGLWFKRGDLEDLKNKIKVTLNDELIRSYSKNSYEEYWNNDYSVYNHVIKLKEVYEEVLERG